jgi:hypothetical protein
MMFLHMSLCKEVLLHAFYGAKRKWDFLRKPLLQILSGAQESVVVYGFEQFVL